MYGEFARQGAKNNANLNENAVGQKTNEVLDGR